MGRAALSVFTFVSELRAESQVLSNPLRVFAEASAGESRSDLTSLSRDGRPSVGVRLRPNRSGGAGIHL